jgi:UDP-N-acetylmuramate--alanine ligase
VRPFADLRELALLVRESAQAGDIVICLGAGSITTWANSLPGELAQQHDAGRCE